MNALFFSHTALFEGFYAYFIRDPVNDLCCKPHYHNFYELQIHFDNTGSITIANKKYDLHSGDIAFIDIFEKHSYEPGAEKHDYISITLEPSFLLAVCSNKSNLLNLWSQKNKNSPVFHLDDEAFKIINSIVGDLKQKKLKHGQDLLERALIHTILAYLYNIFFDGKTIDDMESQHVEIIARLTRFIASHLNEELSLERLSDEVNFSKFHICRIFKKYTGNTITKYIVSNRIEKAKSLLRENSSIEKISEETGFNNYPYFYKAFKKLTGFSPMDYRKMVLGI